MYLTHCLLNEGLVLFSFLQWTLFHFILHTFDWAVFSCQHTTVQQTTVLKASQLTQWFLFTPEECFRNHGCAGGWMTAYTKKHKTHFQKLCWAGTELKRLQIAIWNIQRKTSLEIEPAPLASLLVETLTKDWEGNNFPILSFLCCHISSWARLWGKISIKLISNKFAMALYLWPLFLLLLWLRLVMLKRRVSFPLLENQVGSSCSHHCSNADFSGGSVFFFWWNYTSSPASSSSLCSCEPRSCYAMLVI